MAYVDGFVVPVPRRKLATYRRLALKTARIFLELGALEFRECVGDDLDVKMGRPFPRQLALERGETVVFSWILYESRAQRDRVNAAAMKDPRMKELEPDGMPFDMTRMLYGGFKAIVDVTASREAGQGAGRGNGRTARRTRTPRRSAGNGRGVARAGSRARPDPSVAVH